MSEHSVFLFSRVGPGRCLAAVAVAGAIVLAAAGLGTGEEVSSPSGAATDELLDYAIMDLRSVMADSAAKNERLAEKIAVLQQRLAQYRVRVADLRAREEELRSAYKMMQADLELQRAEQEFLQDKAATIQETGPSLLNSQGQLRGQIDAERRQQQQLNEEIETLRGELALFKKRLRQRRGRSAVRQLTREKRSLQRRVDQARRRMIEAQERAGALQLGTETRRRQLLDEQASWQNKIKTLTARLRAQQQMDAQQQSQEEKERQARREQRIQEIRQDNAGLQEDLYDLETAVRQARQAQQDIADTSAQQLAALRGFKDLLLRERQVLKNPPAAVKVEEEPAEEISDQQIRQQEQDLLALRETAEALTREVMDLNRQVTAALGTAPDGGAPEALQIKQKLEEMLSDYEETEPSRSVDAQAAALAEVPPVPDPALEQQVVQDRIAVLKLRQEILANSLSIIESRYRQERRVADAFVEEEQQMREYLAVLSEENKGLQARLRERQPAEDPTQDPQ